MIYEKYGDLFLVNAKTGSDECEKGSDTTDTVDNG